MKAVVRIRRGKSWRYVVRGTTWPAKWIMRLFMGGKSTAEIAYTINRTQLLVEGVIREARGSRWWRP